MKDETEGVLVSDGFALKTSLKFVHNHERADDSAHEDHVIALLNTYSSIEEIVFMNFVLLFDLLVGYKSKSEKKRKVMVKIKNI